MTEKRRRRRRTTTTWECRYRPIGAHPASNLTSHKLHSWLIFLISFFYRTERRHRQTSRSLKMVKDSAVADFSPLARTSAERSTTEQPASLFIPPHLIPLPSFRPVNHFRVSLCFANFSLRSRRRCSPRFNPTDETSIILNIQHIIWPPFSLQYSLWFTLDSYGSGANRGPPMGRLETASSYPLSSSYPGSLETAGPVIAFFQTAQCGLANSQSESCLHSVTDNALAPRQPIISLRGGKRGMKGRDGGVICKHLE